MESLVKVLLQQISMAAPGQDPVALRIHGPHDQHRSFGAKHHSCHDLWHIGLRIKIVNRHTGGVSGFRASQLVHGGLRVMDTHTPCHLNTDIITVFWEI